MRNYRFWGVFMSSVKIIDGDNCHNILTQNAEKKLAFDKSQNYDLWRKKVKQKLYKLLIQLHYFYLEYLEKIFAPSKLVNLHKYIKCFSKELDYYKKITKSNEDSNHCKKEQDGNKD